MKDVEHQLEECRESVPAVTLCSLRAVQDVSDGGGGAGKAGLGAEHGVCLLDDKIGIRFKVA